MPVRLALEMYLKKPVSGVLKIKLQLKRQKQAGEVATYNCVRLVKLPNAVEMVPLRLALPILLLRHQSKVRT